MRVANRTNPAANPPVNHPVNHPANHPVNPSSYHRLALLCLILLGFALRVQRLDWQPLWWDEGYSVYFATEPMLTMFRLTAQDIHPPFYYLLLQWWMVLVDSTAPSLLRFFSAAIGTSTLPIFAWFLHTLFSCYRQLSPRIQLIAITLLVISPFHIFYSQEIRMYSLAMLLCLMSTTYFFRLLHSGSNRNTIGYILSASLALHTLYYSGFLLLAYTVGWTSLSVLGTARTRFTKLLSINLAIAVSYLPWLLYAVPKLISYVQDKVVADQDTPLTPLAYLGRHLWAFTSGHIPASGRLVHESIGWLRISSVVGATVITIIVVLWWRHQRRQANRKTSEAPEQNALAFVAICFVVPILIGYLVNLRLPFFPDGGERLMLFIFPYFVTIVALGIAVNSGSSQETLLQGRSTQQTHNRRPFRLRRYLSIAATLTLIAGAIIGTTLFYTVPRYTDRDYRALVGQVTQQSGANDAILAVFPWQVGYVRAYMPTSTASHMHTFLLPETAEGIQWTETMADTVREHLQVSRVWFAAPVSFGGTLATELEQFLGTHGVNLDRRWYGPATRLSVWQALPEPEVVAVNGDYADLQLIAAGISPIQIASENDAVSIKLRWNLNNGDDELGQQSYASLRLQDQSGYTWAIRDYTPLRPKDHLGMIVPAGIPPGTYYFNIGVGRVADQTIGGNTGDGVLLSQTDGRVYQPLGIVEIMPPSTTLTVDNLPIEHNLYPTLLPTNDTDIRILGYAGIDETTELLAGTEFKMTLFYQKQTSHSPYDHIYVSLLNKDGAGVGGWEGWPLPDYPLAKWPQDALTTVPIRFFLAASIPDGQYDIITGFINTTTGEKSPPTLLNTITIQQRDAVFTPTIPSLRLPAPAQIGNHAILHGYDLAFSEQINITLHWEALQPLLPPHQVFVHLIDLASGSNLPIVQDDGPPHFQSPTGVILLPTGSWHAEEFFQTSHQLALPTASGAVKTLDDVLANGLAVRIGLYQILPNPATGHNDTIRLPVTIHGETVGDAIALP